MNEEMLVNIKLPRQTLEKIEKIIEKHDGLFENVNDYIHHCIIDYNRKINV
jgi:hypothetical protein